MDRSNPAGSIYGWVNEPNAAVKARATAPDAASGVFWAEADGFHMLFENGEGNRFENQWPFPPGVTLADLPPTSYFTGSRSTAVGVMGAAPTVKPGRPWPMAALDGLHQVDASGALNPPITFAQPPVKGCVVVTFTHTLNEYRYQCLIFDGTKWHDGSSVWHGVQYHGHRMTSMEPGAMTVNGWFNSPTAVADAKDACRGTGEVTAAAAADGIHSFCRNSDGTVNETKDPYPPGVTQADMAPTHVWVTAPAHKPPPKAANTPNAKAWVGGVTDTVRIPIGPGQFDTALPTSPAPVKGCVYLSFADSGDGQNINANAFIHDGANWVAGQGWDMPMANPGGGSNDAPQIKAWYFGDVAAAKGWAWDQGDELTAAAAADGIHLLAENERGDVNEYTVPYPTGVTMGDMPASRTF
jgi:hypothetical protein